MSLSVTALGCSGTWAGPGTACSGYLLRSDTTAVWMDCGSGTLANLQRHLPLSELDGVVVSHSHPDHWLELPVTLNGLRYGLGLGDLGLPLLLTRQTAELFRAVSGQVPEPTFASEVVDATSTATIGDIDLSFAVTDHPVETLAIRADSGGSSVVYTADTGDAWRLAELAEGVDLAVVEATLDEAQRGVVQHLTGRQAGVQAAEAGVSSLVLTHLAPGSDGSSRLRDAGDAYDGPIALAEIDGRYDA